MNRFDKKIVITTSWDDGHVLDLKLAKLLKKYGIPATFYIPLSSSKQEIISPDSIRDLYKSFEIGCHTSTHANLTQINTSQALNEIKNGKEGLEKILRHSVSMFSYPFGSYNSEIIPLLKDVGLKGARTTKIFSTEFINNKFKIATTIHASNHSLTSYLRQVSQHNVKLSLYLMTKKILYNWEAMSNESLLYVVEHGGIWHLWGHSWEIEKNRDWDTLERVFKMITQIKYKHPEIIMSTNSGLLK